MSKSVGVRFDKDDEKVWEAFKEFVKTIHGKKHTVLGKETAEALRRYMGEYGRVVVILETEDAQRVAKEGEILQTFFTENGKNGNGVLFGHLFSTLKYRVLSPLIKRYNNSKNYGGRM